MTLRGVNVDPAALRMARVAAGLSLSEVVKGSDFTRQAVYLVESGRNRPSRELLRVIARNLRRRPADFVAPGHDFVLLDFALVRQALARLREDPIALDLAPFDLRAVKARKALVDLLIQSLTHLEGEAAAASSIRKETIA